MGGDKIGKGLEYDPLLESKMGLFERHFRKALAEDKEYYEYCLKKSF